VETVLPHEVRLSTREDKLTSNREQCLGVALLVLGEGLFPAPRIAIADPGGGLSVGDEVVPEPEGVGCCVHHCKVIQALQDKIPIRFQSQKPRSDHGI